MTSFRKGMPSVISWWFLQECLKRYWCPLRGPAVDLESHPLYREEAKLNPNCINSPSQHIQISVHNLCLLVFPRLRPPTLSIRRPLMRRALTIGSRNEAVG
ncbi:hypothetical protein CEXT_47941 [Caerostris extrusa]|uniref:Uncharacterized protein n=1 Tax=Caerostris extrusa TaxID=172846 RepID=A0AAV4T7P7_CAEEX|nr:hypothetical protein CEXT_47941 [Caerostris extrusa]